MVLNQNLLNLFSAVDLTSSIDGPILDISNVRMGSVSATWTGTPNGTFVLQTSNEITTGTALPSSGSFDDISGSSLAVTAAGQQTWVFNQPYYAKWFRIKYTATSGTGTITAASIATKQEAV